MLRIAITLLLATPAAAQTLLSGDEFEAWVEGETYYSSVAGEQPYGMLLYRENRQVMWASFDDECVEGFWTEPLPGVICFEYPAWAETFCWQFYADGDELFSLVYEGNGTVYYDRPTTDTLPCLAPFLGV